MKIVKLSQVAPGQMCFSADFTQASSWCNKVSLSFKDPMLVIRQRLLQDTQGYVWPIATVLTRQGVTEFSGAVNVTLDAELKGFTFK
jgi:hypothetical protein